MQSKKAERNEKVKKNSASMADIDKILKMKPKVELKTIVLEQYWDHLNVFDEEETNQLPPIRGFGIDHQIELLEKERKKPIVPWGPLYNMSKDELLVLRKTLTEHLDKSFIRVSNSPAAAPVLFVKKPGGGLRFCVDYRGLNRITKKDRYPLPLIYETLRNIGKAKWYTKFDVRTAFHKIKIAEKDEWMIAFRTRYGFFEWLVTPFGLANAFNTFQKYINWALKDFLNEFCSAYIDDILIYIDGSRTEHQKQIKKILKRLREAGLQLDVSKCEFEVKTTKYLGFIIEVNKSIAMDPAKVETIVKWEAPRTVKGVQGFLGFANFYRKFIKNFSQLVMPLTNLMKKKTRNLTGQKQRTRLFRN